MLQHSLSVTFEPKIGSILTNGKKFGYHRKKVCLPVEQKNSFTSFYRFIDTQIYNPSDRGEGVKKIRKFCGRHTWKPPNGNIIMPDDLLSLLRLQIFLPIRPFTALERKKCVKPRLMALMQWQRTPPSLLAVAASDLPGNTTNTGSETAGCF